MPLAGWTSVWTFLGGGEVRGWFSIQAWTKQRRWTFIWEGGLHFWFPPRIFIYSMPGEWDETSWTTTADGVKNIIDSETLNFGLMSLGLSGRRFFFMALMYGLSWGPGNHGATQRPFLPILCPRSIAK